MPEREPEEQLEEMEEREKELDREIDETEQDWESTQQRGPLGRRREAARRGQPRRRPSGLFAIQSAFWIANPSQSLLK